MSCRCRTSYPQVQPELSTTDRPGCIPISLSSSLPVALLMGPPWGYLSTNMRFKSSWNRGPRVLCSGGIVEKPRILLWRPRLQKAGVFRPLCVFMVVPRCVNLHHGIDSLRETGSTDPTRLASHCFPCRLSPASHTRPKDHVRFSMAPLLGGAGLARFIDLGWN